MIGCDYNGWNDVPEDEREWMDQYPELSSSAESLDSERSPGAATLHSELHSGGSRAGSPLLFTQPAQSDAGPPKAEIAARAGQPGLLTSTCGGRRAPSDPSNPERAFMDHILEWRLIYRTADDVRALFARSKFGDAPYGGVHR